MTTITTIINFGELRVSSKTREGTLAEVNCDLLPTASKCSDEPTIQEAVKEAMSCLSAIYKNAVRYGQSKTIDEVQKYYAIVERTAKEFMQWAGFSEMEWLNIIMACGLKMNKKEGRPVLISETTFKKTILRVIVSAQASGGMFNTNTVKAEKAKKEKVTKSKSKPIINYAAIAEKLGVSVSAVMEAMDAEAKAQVC